MKHIPVLLNKVLEILEPIPGKFIIDGTVDGGGHAEAIIGKMMPKGKFLAVDWDEKLLEETKERLESEFKIPNSDFKVFWANDNFADMPRVLEKESLGKANGLLLDLGFSSEQLEQSGKGFSFLKDEVLDMRYQPNRKLDDGTEERRLTAAEIINSFTEKDLADIFWKYGEERFSRKIAENIVSSRKKMRIMTTFELVEIVRKSMTKNYEHGRINPATRVFQALRIYVNGELDNLETGLRNLKSILRPGGRAAIISFHSLEDRLVKNHFREMEKEGTVKILTKKPVQADEYEISINPRSRSAKLRAIEII